MWVPKTEEEITKAVTTTALEETAIFDAKKELPSKNPELAKDIAAMANDGGTLIYGIAEDASGRPTILNPIPLADQSERVTAIVQTSIAESPKIVISTIPTASDPSRGYLVVIVPPSDRAPHMVVVKGENRYYGRTATGNYPLGEAEVARLYERRQRMEVDRDALLAEAIARAPLSPRPGFAYLHLVVRPVFRDEGLLDRAVRTGETPQRVLFDLVAHVADPEIFPGNYSPDFYHQSRWIHRAEGFLAQLGSAERDDDPRAPAHTLNLQVDFDGSAHLFCGRAAERESAEYLFFPSIVAGNTTRFLTLVGKLYTKARYVGMVDVCLAITGLKGSIPDTTNVRWMLNVMPYDRDEYRRTTRASALVLSDNPQSVARSLLMPLFNAVSQGKLDPFPKTTS
jgi:schlafen family protein